jgi:hypothetical protein
MEIEMALHPDALAELEAASAARKRKDAELPCAAIERRRADHVHLREQAIENMRAIVARGGKGLQ